MPLALWALYLVGANLFLGTELGARTINRKPEKFLIEWQRAWSIVPGRVEVRGLRIRSQNGVVQWQASLDRAQVPVALHRLMSRSFRATAVQGSGLTFNLRKRLDAIESESPKRAAQLREDAPEIPGLFNPPSPRPEELPRPPASSPGWRIELEDLHVDDVREVWIDSARLTGSGELHADFDLTVRERLELSGSNLRFQNAELELGGDDAAADVGLDLALTIAPLVPGRDSGKRALAFLSGAVTVSGNISGLTALDSLFGGAGWLTTSASGRLDATAIVELGELRPGTRLAIDTDEISVGFAGNQVSGRGTVRSAIAGQEPTLETEIDLDRVELQRVGADRPHARDAHFRYTGRSSRLQLSDKPFTDLHSRLELEGARVDDLSVYDDYLLSANSIGLSGGPAFLSGHLEASAVDGRASGELSLDATRLRATVGDVRLAGRLALDVRLGSARLDERRYDLSGSVLRLTDVEVREHDRTRTGWWARVELATAELHQAARPTLEADVSATLRDSGPVVALIADRKRFLRLFDGLLTVKDVVAKVRVESRPDQLELAALDITGGKLEVLGDLELAKGSREGLLFLRFGMLSGAVELDGEKRDWKLIRSRAWFERRRAERSAAHR